MACAGWPNAQQRSVVQIRGGMDFVLGTGFFIGDDGHIATAAHVVDAAGTEDLYVGLAPTWTPPGAAESDLPPIFSNAGLTVIRPAGFLHQLATSIGIAL